MQAEGRVLQVMGPVIDVQFEAGEVPPIYNAIEVTSEGFDTPIEIDITLEVAHHLGEGLVKCVAMQPTDGVVRGMKAIDTGGPILTSFSLASDGRSAAFAASSASHPADVFFFKNGKAARRLTNCNPWLDHKRLAKQEVIRYKARDGETVEGVLIRPLNEKPGQRYPLILTVHGGPGARARRGQLGQADLRTPRGGSTSE